MWNWVSELQNQINLHEQVALVTLIECRGSTPREVGAKMIVLKDGRFFGTIGGGLLEQKVLAEAVMCLHNQETVRLEFQLCEKAGQCCGGVVDVLIEVLKRPNQLYVFGAGHVGQAVARVFQGTPFQVHLIDEREEWINSDLIPPGVLRHKLHWREFANTAQWSALNTYAVIMTYSHDMDRDLIESLVRKPARYLGLIGSESKWRRFQTRLYQRGLTQSDLSRVTCPIGLDIGGKSPQEVAISLAAELIRIHNSENGKPKSHLRSRKIEVVQDELIG